MADKIEKTVLFVDDDPPVLSSLRRLLRKEPWHLLFANCAKEGLDLLTEHPVDLVVSDMRMPEMDGAGFLRKIKDLYPQLIMLDFYDEPDKTPAEKWLPFTKKKN